MSTDGNTEGTAAPRILIANDQEWTARSLESILVAEGYEVVRAFTGQQAYDRALEIVPDLVLLDTQLPDINGPEVCRRLRAEPRFGWGIPVILTTAGSNGRSRQSEVLEAGAWDFATQPFDGPLLLLRIRTYLRAKQELDLARRDAMVDHLTGLYNRHGLEHKLGEIAAEARRRREPVTCLAFSAGPPALAEAMQRADEMGRLVGRTLRSVVRGSDVVARVSALDFVLVAPTLTRDVALKLVKRFEQALGRLPPATMKEFPLRAGIAANEDVEQLDAADLLRRALSALDWSSAEKPVAVAD